MSKKNNPYYLSLPKKYKFIYGHEMNFNHSITENKEYISKVTMTPKNFSLISNKRKSEFISGRICAQKSLEKLNIYGEAIGICCDRSPRWPENVVGSITHNELRAVAIVASNQNYSNLGVDIECVVTTEVGDLICATIIDDKEYLMMDSVTISQLTKEAFITLIFSAKESIFKALYRDVGHFFGFEVAKLIKISKCILTFELRKNLSKKWYSGIHIDVYYRVNDKEVFTMVAISTIPHKAGNLGHTNM